MTSISKQPLYYVVFFDIDYPSIADAINDKPGAIATHKERSTDWHKNGKIVMAGAFRDTIEGNLQTMGVLIYREVAEEYAKGDPFVLNGKVKKWYIREWNNMLM